MVRLRRAGLIVFGAIFIAVIGAAFATEGLGLAVIAAIAAFVVAGLVVPVLAMFEELMVSHPYKNVPRETGAAAQLPRLR